MRMSVTVLVADDSPAYLEVLARTVQRTPGWTLVGRAENGVDAERAILRLRPRLAILDDQMPGRRGIEVVERLRAHGSTTRCVIVTAAANADLPARAADVDCRVLDKADPTRDLIGACRALLGDEDGVLA